MSSLGFQLELIRPGYLVGLLLLALVGYFFYRSLSDLPRWQRIVSLVVRSAVVVLLVLAAAGLTLLRPTHEKFVIFALDESASVGERERQTAAEFVDAARKEAGVNRVAVLPFAAVAGTVHAEHELASPQELDRQGSNLAAAIEVAAAAITPFYVPEIVLLTDGNQTAGDVLSASLAAGIPVSTVPLAGRDDPDVQVSSVEVPAQVRQGEPFYVDVVIDANHDDEGEIKVYRGPHELVSQRQKIVKGENRFRFRQTVDDERLANFTARVEGFKDTLLDNNSASGVVFTSGKPRVLLVESEPAQAKNFSWAMEEEDIQIEVRPPQGIPESLADLQNFELVVLSNVPATALSMRQMQVMRSYVEDLGGGLVMIGGEQSFGLGGYYKTLIEEILPVRSDFEKEKEKPSLGMILVIDKSGSMGGEKIELAKDAAKSAVELLGASDRVGVIAFDGQSYWVSELHPCSDKAYVLERISTLEAGGGTNMYPAMEDAFVALQAAPAKLKHCIVLTDGISAPGDFEGLTAMMAADRITVTTVAVGNGADQDLLERIARTGNGRYYFCDDPSTVPQIFAKETVTASKAAINEQPFVPQVIRPTPVLSEIDMNTAPFLLGYVVTRTKPTSELILATEAGDPLLSWWRYGLGMTVAFTSDAKSRWAAEWLSWPGYNKFWAQIVRHAMRKSEAKGVEVKIDRHGADAVVTLDAADAAGQFVNLADTDLTLVAPDLTSQKIAMRQIAPGRYQADIKTPTAGSYHLELAQQAAGQTTFRQTRGLTVGYADELRLRPTNESLLRQVASSTGGLFSPQPAEVFRPTDRTAERATPLWPPLLIAALVLFVLDVALRRIDFSLVLGGWRFARK